MRKEHMSIYTELGITPIVNAAGTLTRFSGSLMPPEVTDAMAAASRSFVDMNELHLTAGQRIAELIGVQAAHVCAGATAGIALMAAACMAGTDRGKIVRLPDTAGMKHRFVVQWAHRNPFDQALRVAGGEFVEINADADELVKALNDEVAAVFYTLAWFCTREALPLEQVTAVAHRAEIPNVIIPKENEKDIKDIPDKILNALTLHLVDHMDEVVELSLTEAPCVREECEPEETPPPTEMLKEGGGEQPPEILTRTH